jgi:hypothetical protein
MHLNVRTLPTQLYTRVYTSLQFPCCRWSLQKIKGLPSSQVLLNWGGEAKGTHRSFGIRDTFEHDKAASVQNITRRERRPVLVLDYVGCRRHQSK